MGKLSQKSQRAVLSAEANQELDHAHIRVPQILAPRKDRFFVPGEISSHAVVVLSIATAWALVRVRVMGSRGEGSGIYVVWKHVRTSCG